MRSQNGASYALISSLPSLHWMPVLSVPLYVQYQDVLLRPGLLPSAITADDVTVLCRYLASVSHLQEVYFLWRPRLHDRGDDMVLELAVAAQAEYIITHNIRDFSDAASLGVRAIRPSEFLDVVRKL